MEVIPTSEENSVSPHLACGCGPHYRKQPHVAVAWRAAQIEGGPDLWQSAANVISAQACGLRYQVSRIVGLIPCGGQVSIVELGNLVESWHQQISASAGPVSGGRSAIHAGQAGLSQAVCEALSALRVGDRVNGPGGMTAYSDIFFIDYAARLLNDPRLGGLFDRVPSRLRTIDRGRDALVPTLETFLAKGSIQGTAAELSVHRNTVINRLKKIEKITRINLADPETRFLVNLSLHADRCLARESA